MEDFETPPPPDLTEKPSDPEPNKRPNPLDFTRFGCISAVVLLGLGITACSLGNRWLFEPNSIFSQEFGNTFLSTFISGSSQALFLLIAGLILWRLRQPHLSLLRGVGAGFLIGAIYTTISSLLISWDASLPYPGIADWIPSAVLIALAIPFLLIFGKGKMASAIQPALLGLGLGILAAAPWAFLGGLGEPLEILAAIGDSLAYGLWLGLALMMVFYWQEDIEPHQIIWFSLLAAGFGAAMLPTFLAGRGGYTLTAVVLTPALCTMPLVAMLTLWPADVTHNNRWLPTAAFSSGFLAIPLLFFDPVEATFMPEISIRLGSGLVAVCLLALFFASIWLIVRLVNEPHNRPLGALAILLTALIAVLVGAWLADGPVWQTDTFFVVMADQTETDFANGISERDERVSAVYETLVDHANQSQADVRTLLDESGADYTPFYLVNGIEVAGRNRLRRQLARRDDVAWIIDSPQTRPEQSWAAFFSSVDMTTLSTAEPAPTEPVWGIVEIGAPRVWTEFDVHGAGIILGSADSGVDFTHPALESGYLGGGSNHDYTWFDPALNASSPEDSGGHGTHTTGTAVGQFGIGVAPEAKWIACRNLPRNLGNPADYVACMQFLFAPFPIGGDPFKDGDPTRGAHVTNNSWGCPREEGCDGRTVGIGFDHLRNAGQMSVISNGNSGPECSTTEVPAATDSAFSVGALDVSGDRVIGFSSRGPATDIDGDILVKPDIIAPGVEIISALPGDTYGPSQGTSMAGPHVAGAVALLWSADPSLIGDIGRTEELLTSTARQIDVADNCIAQIDANGANNTSGHGILDIYEAVKMALEDSE